MEEDERRLSFPPPAPLNSPGEEIDGSRLLGEIVRTLEATNPEAAAPLVASQSRDALDAECEKPRREELRIPLDGVTFSSETREKGGGGTREEPRAAVTPFTRESARRAGSRGAQLVREFGFMPRRRLSVEDGARLPRKYEPFPPKLYGRPLEEIDNFIYDETFCVVSKRFRKNYIHRFTATRSLFWWSPWSPVRRACVYLSTNQYFDYFVMATILFNCVFLAMSETIEEAEYIFLAIYSAEMIIKCIAKGFILNKYTYLRNPWNWLDFVVITSGYATIGMEVGNLAGLRTFRVLRALKTVSIMPGLKTIINALLHSFKQLAEVMTLTIFCLMVFALFALQVYMGELRNKCVKNFVPVPGENFTDDVWLQWIREPSHWMVNDEEIPIICGNLTGARHCPPQYTCLCVGPNPNHGYTNFDNFLWSMLTTFQLITLDYWENVYNMVLSSCGPMSVSFFTVVVFFGSFYLINLMLAVVALSYEEESQITQEERKKDLNEHRDDSTFSFDPTSLAVRTLAKDSKKRIDARKGLLLASYSRKRTRRRKRGKSAIHHAAAVAAVAERSRSRSRSRSVTPSASPPLLPPPLPPPPPHTLHPDNALVNDIGRGALSAAGRQLSDHSNNRESSLDDSGVVDDHDDGEHTSDDQAPQHHPRRHHVPLLSHQLPMPMIQQIQESQTVAIKPKNITKQEKQDKPQEKPKKCEKSSIQEKYPLNPDYLNQIVVLGADWPYKRAPDLPQTETTKINEISLLAATHKTHMGNFEQNCTYFTDELVDRNCECCVSCCIDYEGWLQFQNCLYGIVKDPLFELFITTCIVLNTLFLALEHHGMSENVRQALDIGNKVFTSIFTLECMMKVMAMSKDFFACGWNIFDLIIVSASLLDLIFELVDGLSVLRGLRLLRVLKLAQSWTTMKVLLSIIISTIGALGNLTFVLVIVIYIFAVIGMQLFSKSYTPDKFEPDPVPRWNFNDFFHSFMMIFRILCGEWIEPLWDCMRAEQASGAESCFFIFLPALVMGNFMVLNLFLALLLNSFNSEELKNKKEEVGEDSKLAKSFDRIRSIVRKKGFLISRSKETEKKSKLEELVNEFMAQQRAEKEKKVSIPSEQRFSASIQETILFPHDNIYSHSYQEALNRPISVGSDFAYPQLYQANFNHGSQETLKDVRDLAAEHKITSIREDSKENLEDTSPTEPVVAQKLLNQMSSGYHTQPSDSRDENEHYEMAQLSSRTTPERRQYGKDTPNIISGRKNSKGQYVDAMGNFPGFGKAKEPKVPQDCYPRQCYDACPCWDSCIETKMGQRWMLLRTFILRYVDTPAFEWFVLVLIFASSITLCFEDIHLEKNKPLKKILYWTNLGFCMIFVVEMFLKWIALGFFRYFTSFWTLLDFTIVFVSVFSLLIEENENLKVLRSLRTLRALRPLRAISRWQGMRIVVNALMYAIPSIFNVLLVCLVFWLIFSIMGVQFFGGKFFKCVDNEGELLPLEIVNDKWECYYNNFSWINSKISFDHVGIAYLALFQVATFEGWMEVMADAVDARGVDLQPAREANLYAYIYFVIFIVCGSFFTLNLFIGVIIDNFNMLKKKYEGGVLEMFLTESQKHYYTAMKKLGRKKPQKVIKRPRNQFLAMFYDLSNSRRFEIAIFVLIFLNMLTMGIEHYDQPHSVFFILEVSNAFFTTVFGLEAIVKIIGLRYHYFTVPWNVFDFLLVLASILGILMEDIMIDLPISPTLLRVVRVFRIGRILRLIKAAKGIRKLLFALVVSLPALFNIGALLALITFIYAIIGMSVFGHVKEQGALDDIVNFQTFGRSMQLLFRLMTSAGWNDVLESLMIQPPECELGEIGHLNGNCGSPLLAITYFTSFIIISYMIVINMYIAIILENFNQAHQEEEIGIVEDDLEMFYIRWSKYDPHATQFISFVQLSDFIASLDPPLGISKPNTVALVSFNLPIAKGNKIHCLDILHALVKHVLGHVEETDTFRQLQEQMDIKFKKQFPTRKELEIVSSTRIWKREDKAARMIQRTWREYVKRKNRSPSNEEESTKWSPGGGWGGRLSALLHVRRGSHASSRKSSRASDASDLSELGGAWLNLPLLLLPGANPGDQVASGSETAPPRRRSAYGLPIFLRHQDAVDEDGGPKRAGSLRLSSRRNSARRAGPGPPGLPPRPRTPSPHANSEVSILVTEASPDAAPPPAAPPTVVRVLVHRESDEQPS
ncbi:sodium channel protein 60E-like isoform X3 [Plodia interpunctella]|uniref:sodium channel protein 60E-like isoform X3 n=1 Tax=Plodia interpunctella TaxID=58824 RepID=UPI002368BB18|nr:sodium channel protein 60E-like isoform X3 [Plodia interpunctella]